MTARRRPAALDAAVAVSVLLVLAWVAGGQAALGRIDPALVLPWLALVLVLLERWRQARENKLRGPAKAGTHLRPDRDSADRRRTPAFAGEHGFLVVVLLLLPAQAILALLLAGQMPWAQLGLVGVGAVLVAWLAAHLARWRVGRAVRGMVALLLIGVWFAGSHLLLAALYRAPPAAGAPVTMLTGLPLRWSADGDMAAMIAQGMSDDPALQRIEAAGPVRLIDSLIDHPPAPGGTLFLAHPRALAPRELVAVDAFVRGGGRAVILADALSGWPARHPLGDPRNPPVTSLLTPLLDHWGVTLGAAPAGERGPLAIDIDGARLRLFSAGQFERFPATCQAHAGRRILHCRIDRGEAWLVGDADLIFAPLWRAAPDWAAHLRRADTMEWLAASLWPRGRQAILRPLWIRAIEQAGE
ncbi:Gldg family protein [Sphingopyxis sp. 550A]